MGMKIILVTLSFSFRSPRTEESACSFTDTNSSEANTEGFTDKEYCDYSSIGKLVNSKYVITSKLQ